MQHGDFTELAEAYARFRPGYSPFVRDALFGLLGKPAPAVDAADVGAGTGIWSAMLEESGCRVAAVEPNAAMRQAGEKLSAGRRIAWREGSGEATGLGDASCDLLTMASSFHWTDFPVAVAEFSRVLRPGGLFCALWNTREVERDPLTAEIEARLREMAPNMRRVSSGRSEFCDGLFDRLAGCGHFSDVLYLEGRHVEHMAPERYLGIWRSVNDVRVQLGEQGFADFLAYVEGKVSGVESVAAHYLTRAWAARRRAA